MEVKKCIPLGLGASMC